MQHHLHGQDIDSMCGNLQRLDINGTALSVAGMVCFQSGGAEAAQSLLCDMVSALQRLSKCAGCPDMW